MLEAKEFVKAEKAGQNVRGALELFQTLAELRLRTHPGARMFFSKFRMPVPRTPSSFAVCLKAASGVAWNWRGSRGRLGNRPNSRLQVRGVRGINLLVVTALSSDVFSRLLSPNDQRLSLSLCFADMMMTALRVSWYLS